MKSLFARSSTYISNSVQRYTQLLEWADGSGSDLFALLNAYSTWQQVNGHNIGRTKTERNIEYARQEAWCDRFGLDLKALRECRDLIKDIKCRILRLKLSPMQIGKNKWTDEEKHIILKVVIAGAFYPNYFIRDSPVRVRTEREMFESLGGNNPCNTVYFTNFDSKYVRHIYIKAIKNYFVKSNVVDDPDKVKVTIENGSHKIFVTFKVTSKKDDKRDYGFASMPGFVATEVYKAIKMRQAQIKLKLHVIRDSSVAIDYACSQNLYIDHGNFVPIDEESYDDYCYPKMNQTEIKGFITCKCQTDSIYFN